MHTVASKVQFCIQRLAGASNLIYKRIDVYGFQSLLHGMGFLFAIIGTTLGGISHSLCFDVNTYEPNEYAGHKKATNSGECIKGA
jgi:hypothetical protein